MLKELLKNKKFRSTIKEFYEKDKDIIIDVLLFGSIAKGKRKPGDIDILIIGSKKISTDKVYELRKKLKKISLEFSIKVVTYQDLFSSSFLAREAFLSESYSLITNLFVAQGLGFSNFYLFKYDLKDLNKSKRMLFYYSLYGRNKKSGMLNVLNAIKFSNSILLVPVEKAEEAKEYFDNIKVKFIDIPILIPSRIVESDILKEELLLPV